MNEIRLRKVEMAVSSTRRTAKLLGTNANRVWLWRRGAIRLKPEELETLEAFLKEQLDQRLATLAESLLQ